MNILDENNILTLDFNTINHDNPSTIKISINGNILIYHQFSKQHESISVPINHGHGQCLLEIEKYSNQEISNHSTLSLVGLSFNEISLPDHFLKMGSWHCKNSGMIEVSQCSWNFDGVWKWAFSVPVVPWAVRQVRLHDQVHPDLFNPCIEENMQILNEQLDLLEQVLSQ